MDGLDEMEIFRRLEVCARFGERLDQTGHLARTEQRDYSGLRKIFSIFLPFASSSINLSKNRIFCINGSSISSTRIPQTTPLIKEAFGFNLGALIEECCGNPSSPGFAFPTQPYYIQ